MNNLEYLNTIAKDTRPSKPAKSGVSGSTILKIALGGLALFIILLIFGSALGNKSSKSLNLTKQLLSRTTTVNEITARYGKSLKSSQLRAISLSLGSVLTGAENQLKSYFTEKDIASKLSEETATSESNFIANLDQTLTNAKLNGILDRIYANQLQLQVSLLLSLVSQTLSRTKDESLIPILDSYRSNLTIIEDNLQSYSNPSD